MKKTILTLTCVLSFLMSYAAELEETRSLDSFDKIIVTNGMNVLLRKSTEEKAEVKIDNGLLSDVITEVSKGTLKVKVRPQINKELSVLVIVYYKNLKELTASKGGTIETKNLLMADKLEMKASTGGEIKAETETNELEVNATGGGNIKLYGWTKRLDAYTNTKSKIDGKRLKSDNVIAKAATGGEIWVSPKDYLEAIANTSGIVYYTSKPTKINKKVSSGGEVINKVKAIGDDLIRDAQDQ